MSLCKSLARLFPLLIVGFVLPTHAGHLVNVNLWNWGEEFQMTKDGVTQDSNSNFSALGLEYEYSSGLKKFGWNASGTLLLGQATGGDGNGDIVYIASYQQFFGAAAKINMFWRIEKRIYLEFGPLILMRQFEWPESDGTVAVSGATLNYGPLATLRIRLGQRLDFCQSIGALMVKGSTVYSTALGYRF